MGEKQGHTPGPLTAKECLDQDSWHIHTHDGGWIATVHIDGEPRAAKAYAALFAAAPDLLAVAIKSHQPYVGLDEEDIRCLYGAGEADLAMALRDAISRATGEDSPANEGEGR